MRGVQILLWTLLSAGGLGLSAQASVRASVPPVPTATAAAPVTALLTKICSPRPQPELQVGRPLHVLCATRSLFEISCNHPRRGSRILAISVPIEPGAAEFLAVSELVERPVSPSLVAAAGRSPPLF